jgi:hypothetical protein
MRRSALLLVLAIGAALLGAPSPASAADSALADAAATPPVVAPGALVRLSVSYDGGSAATSVTAEVGGLTFPLVQQSGTLTSGTWASAVTLPIGTWNVIYRATTTGGEAPVLTGPSVTVAAVVAPSLGPGEPDGSVEPEAASTQPNASSPGAPREPAQVARPSPPPTAGSNSEDEPSPAAAAGGGRTPPPAVQVEGGAAPSVPLPPITTTANPRSDDPRGSLAGAPMGPSPGIDAGTAAPTPPDRGTPVGIGLVGVAAIAAVGIGLVVALRERRRRVEPIEVPDGVAEVLDRRTIRQGRVRLEADPIIAALGIGDIPEPRPRGQHLPALVGEPESGDDA